MADQRIWTRADERRVNRLVDELTADVGRLEPRPTQAGRAQHGLQKAVVAVDDSPAAAFAVSWARFLLNTLRTRLLFAHVEEPASLREAVASRTYSPERHHRAAQQILSAAVDEAGGISRRVGSRLATGLIIPRLLTIDGRFGADILIVGSRGQGPWRRLLLGSVSDAVKNEAHHDVLIAKNRAPPRLLMLATDGSTGSKRAATVAVRLARAWKTPLHMLYVAPSRQPGKARMDVFDETFREADWLKMKGLTVTFEVASGRPAEQIVAAATRRRAGLIVLGSRGLSGIRSWVPGGVSNRVSHAAKSSVLLVK